MIVNSQDASYVANLRKETSSIPVFEKNVSLQLMDPEQKGNCPRNGVCS